jgi:penicillin-binding protein 2
VTPYDGVVCKGVIHLGRWPKRCHKRSGHGFVALNESLAASCDVYYYRLGQRLTPEVMAEWARRFGLGKRTGIDLPFVEARGIVPTPKWKEQSKRGRWVGGDTVDYAIGQSMLGCTPLQMCNVAAAIGNGGTLYRPQLVRSITSFNAENKPVVTRTLQPEVIGKLNLKPSTLSALVRGMESVMERGGTAASSSIPGLRIAGKTGTSQIKRRGEMKLNAWFIGFAPVENPKIAVCVFVEEAGHGGEVAAPIARKIIARYLNLNVPDVQVAPTTD